jgi:hypothetical protein
VLWISVAQRVASNKSNPRMKDGMCALQTPSDAPSHPRATFFSYPTFPPSIQSELFYTDAAKRAALDCIKETVMGPQIDRLSSRLPRRFPVGAKYVVEGYGGEKGNLRVIARYVVLPGGRRINVPTSLSQPASPAGPPHSGPILSDPRMAHHVG